MDHNLQAALFGGGLFVAGLLTGELIKKIAAVWKGR
jgi:hypothetical protein